MRDVVRLICLGRDCRNAHDAVPLARGKGRERRVAKRSAYEYKGERFEALGEEGHTGERVGSAMLVARRLAVLQPDARNDECRRELVGLGEVDACKGKRWVR